jgi:hypothetical protein
MLTGTGYWDIYQRFLGYLSDDYLASLSDDELEEQLLPVLSSAIYNLSRLALGAGIDLSKRFDMAQCFTISLGDDEIECLAILMVVKWTEQQLNSSRLIEQQYYDAGVKTYSPNETMKNLLTLHERYTKKAKSALREYAVKKTSIESLGGN